MKVLVVAPDKFGVTATATEVADAVASAAKGTWKVDQAPMADGGEGTLEVVINGLGGNWMITNVHGPYGRPVDALWIKKDDYAFIETAMASGRSLITAEDVDHLQATTYGTGELIAAAIDSGAKRIFVSVGGSATTDGGLGAIEALRDRLPLPTDIELVVATDVTTLFMDCPRIFAPQKGAKPSDIPLLEDRLAKLIDRYKAEFGVDVSNLEGAGAAGGLAGGLAALGAKIVSGFSYLSEIVGLEQRIASADLIVTGEGKVDIQTTQGKVVSGVIELARRHSKPLVLIAGEIDLADADKAFLQGDIQTICLVTEFGREKSMNDPLTCIKEATLSALTSYAQKSDQ